MILRYVQRKDLLDILQNEAINKEAYEGVDEQTIILGLRGDAELQLIWRNKYDRLPSVMIVNSSKKDFLAWAVTYLSNFKPFTAFFRVLEMDFFYSSKTTHYDFNIDKRCEDVFIGLIVAETLTYLEDGNNLDNVNLSTCSRTLSYLLAKAFYLGLDHHFEILSNVWHKLRQLMPQSNVLSGSDIAKAPWAIFMRLFGQQKLKNQFLFSDDSFSSDIFAIAVDDFTRNEWISERTLDNLLKGDPNIKYHRLEFEGTREKRVLAFQELLPKIVESRHSEQTKSFVVGYLVDRLGPGTFEHFNILKSLTKVLPSCIMWYGFFSGLNSRSNLRNISFGLGHRLLRDVLKVSNIFDRPEADISYDEFNMLFPTMKNQSIRTKIKNQLEIEILPNISTNINWPVDRTERSQKQMPIYEIQKLRNEFENSLMKLEDNYRRVLGYIPSSTIDNYPAKHVRKDRSRKTK